MRSRGWPPRHHGSGSQPWPYPALLEFLGNVRLLCLLVEVWDKVVRVGTQAVMGYGRQLTTREILGVNNVEEYD